MIVYNRVKTIRCITLIKSRVDGSDSTQTMAYNMQIVNKIVDYLLGENYWESINRNIGVCMSKIGCIIIRLFWYGVRRLL